MGRTSTGTCGGAAAPPTLGSYRSILDRHLLPEFGDRPVAALDHPLMQRYIAPDKRIKR